MTIFKKIIPLSILIPCLYSPFSLSAGPWMDVRESYQTAYNRHELAIRGGYNFENNAGLLLTNAYDTGKYDQLKHSWNELEGWYPLTSFSKFTVFGGALVNENNDGSGGAAYFDFKYDASDDLFFVLRTRYNFRNYDSESFNNDLQRNNTGEFHLGINYTINEDWSYYFEPTYFQQVNDFHAANGSDHHWEIMHVFTYTGLKQWVPYVDFAYMDRSVSEHEENYRIRLGLRYNF